MDDPHASPSRRVLSTRRLQFIITQAGNNNKVRTRLVISNVDHVYVVPQLLIPASYNVYRFRCADNESGLGGCHGRPA